MNEAIKQMLSRYQCQSTQDFKNALKEIIQEITLLGLWRAKFFEKAAFYGGSALRIFHRLDRFSEDLDFTLLRDDPTFKLAPYNKAVEMELHSFGFDVSIQTQEKNKASPIESAFIKAETKKQFIMIQVSADDVRRIHHQELIKIKMEIDINPAIHFQTEAKVLLQPIPFSVNILKTSDLFAGKMHALLCRSWKTRIKGRDWYDLVWYMAHSVPIRLSYLKAKLIQSHVKIKKGKFGIDDVINLLQEKIANVDFEQAKRDVLPFIKDPHAVDLWSKEFFRSLVSKLDGV